FRVSSCLISHRRMHARENPTLVAKGKRRIFSRNSHLRNHRSAHTSEMLFECMQCGKGCSDFSMLAQHQQTHMGEKPYGCSRCGK
ncbi:Zinc finger protein 697, partial [Apaloderma vittatum]